MTAAVWRWGEDIHAAFLLPGIDRALLAGLGLSLTLAGRKLTLLRMAGDNMGNVRLPVSQLSSGLGTAMKDSINALKNSVKREALTMVN